ncbi:hypothetical protein ACKI16_29465 [Streptomyces scabiei]|uniref:hypothetical protein n=1 Tax=Streptomyces scabiei TaxID=1930 RepID=UPI0038F630C3
MSQPMARLDVTLATSEPRPTWCAACKAYTAVTVDAHALFPTGLTLLTALAVCEICDAPEDRDSD